MKKILTLLGIALALTAAGCSNITNLQQQFNPTYQSINVDANQRDTFNATVTVLTQQMGYTVTRKGAKQGIIEAISSIRQGDIAQSPPVQTEASVRLSPGPDNGTQVQILFTDITQETNFVGISGMGTKQPLASSPLYGMFESFLTGALKK